MARVGFIGLGRMGTPMCQHLLRAGHALTVYDQQPEAAETLRTAGAQIGRSAKDVGEASEVVIVMVPDDADVLAVVAGAGGVLAGAAPGTVVAICSSTAPETAVQAAEAAEAKEVGVIDAPVARGVRGAEAGDLTVFAGGKAEHVNRCRPVFEAFANQICHMGPLGSGQITKTVNNLIHWAEVVGIFEALQLGAALGVHPNTLRPALIAGSVDSRTLRELHLVGLAWPQKDMQVALRLAAASHTAMPLMERVRDLVVGMTKEDLRDLFREGEAHERRRL